MIKFGDIEICSQATQGSLESQGNRFNREAKLKTIEICRFSMLWRAADSRCFGKPPGNLGTLVSGSPWVAESHERSARYTLQGSDASPRLTIAIILSLSFASFNTHHRLEIVLCVELPQFARVASRLLQTSRARHSDVLDYGGGGLEDLHFSSFCRLCVGGGR